MTKVGIIGFGYWGPQLVRNFALQDDAKVVMVSDLREDRLQLAKKLYPYIETTTDHTRLFSSTEVDAVIIATPVRTHHQFGMQALKAGKHVLLEKPLAETADQAAQLVDEAAKRNLILMVDHTFVYTAAVRKIKDVIDSGQLGTLRYYDSVRVNLGIFQPDVNVLWDLSVHDLAIVDYIVQGLPTEVSATGIAHLPGKPENVAYITCFYPSSLLVHIHVNWLSPVKVRQTLIGGDSKMIVYNDLEASEKIRIYDRGVDVPKDRDQIYGALVGYRMGDCVIPSLDQKEALSVEAAHFLRCVRREEKPIASGEAGWRIVKILEAASASLQRRGAPISL